MFYDGSYIKETVLSPAACTKNLNEGGVKVYEVVNENVLFIGCFYNCYGHSITDSLRFLWVFLPMYKDFYADKIANLKIVYITTGGTKGTPLEKSFRKILGILGVSESEITEITKPTQFNSVFIPEPCFWEGNKIEKQCTKKYQQVIDYIITKAAGEKANVTNEAIYLSRTRWQHGLRRKDFGEKTIETAIRNNYPECKIVYPEELQFIDLVCLVSSCHKLIATEGSISHNAVFLPTGSEVVILQKCWLRNRYQKTINELRGLKVTCLKSYLWNHYMSRAKNPMIGPFFLCVTRDIAAYLGCRIRISISERIIYDSLYVYRQIKLLISNICH